MSMDEGAAFNLITIEDFPYICRACLKRGQLIPIFDSSVMCGMNSVKVVWLLRKHAKLEVADDDNLPTNICGTCLMRLLEIHKYSEQCYLNDTNLRLLLQAVLQEEAESSETDDHTYVKVEEETLAIEHSPFDNETSKNNEQIAHSPENQTNITQPSLGTLEGYLADTDLLTEAPPSIVEEADFIPLEHQTDEVTANSHGIDLKPEDLKQEITEENVDDDDEEEDPTLFHQISPTEIENENFEVSDTNILNCPAKTDIVGKYYLYLCKFCTAAFSSFLELIAHQKEANHMRKRRIRGKHNFTCKVCQKVCNSFEELKSHKREAHHYKMNRKPPDAIYKCKSCQKVFIGFEALRKHRKEVNHPKMRTTYPCEVCGKVLTREKLEVHVRTHTREKPYKCQYCPQAFSIKPNLDRHVRIHTGEKPFICEVCGKGFIQAVTLQSHQKIHANEFESGNFICTLCGRGFNGSSALAKHMMYRHGQTEDTIKVEETSNETDQTFVCETCGKSMKTAKALRQHRDTHKRPYICTHCGRRCSSKKNLITHSRTHTGERPYACRFCEKTFSQNTTRNAHMRTHTGEKPYVCVICGKAFTQQGHLSCHLKVHSGERPYSCSYCSSAFALKGNLTVHERTHTGETPYLCNVCGRGFYDSSSRNRHQQSHDR